MKTKCIGIFCLVSLIVSACGQSASNNSTSEVNYLSWGDSSLRQSSFAKAREDSLNICITGQAGTADLERAKLWSKRASLTWLRVMKLIDEKVTSNIRFTCTQKHLTVNLRPGSGTSFASPSVSTIYLTRPYGTWTHEFGHALAGLNDTYAGGAGSCKSGQPQSLMCWGAYGPKNNPDQFSTLWQDDIAGMRANYKRIFGTNLTPPDWADSVDAEEPLDSDAPWPEQFSVEDIDHEVTVLKAGPTLIEAADAAGSKDI